MHEKWVFARSILRETPRMRMQASKEVEKDYRHNGPYLENCFFSFLVFGGTISRECNKVANDVAHHSPSLVRCMWKDPSEPIAALVSAV